MSRVTRDQAQERLLRTIRAYQTATDALDALVADVMGLNRTDARCWDFVDQHGPMTAGELARRAGLTTGAVTGVLDRLEAKGIVHRRRDEQDRRKVVVEVTDEARARAWELYGPMSEGARDLFDRFTVAEVERVSDFLELATRVTEERALQLHDEHGGADV